MSLLIPLKGRLPLKRYNSASPIMGTKLSNKALFWEHGLRHLPNLSSSYRPGRGYPLHHLLTHPQWILLIRGQRGINSVPVGRQPIIMQSSNKFNFPPGRPGIQNGSGQTEFMMHQMLSLLALSIGNHPHILWPQLMDKAPLLYKQGFCCSVIIHKWEHSSSYDGAKQK